MYFFVRKYCSPNHKPVLHTEADKSVSVVVYRSYAMCSHHFLHIFIAASNLGIHVPNDHDGDMASFVSVSVDSVKLIVEIIFDSIFLIFCQGIGHNQP